LRDTVVISESWIEESTRFGADCRLDEARYPAMCYRRAWWIPEPEPGVGRMIAATGHLGQYIYVFPDLDVVVVRFGRRTGGVSWPAIVREVAREIGKDGGG
jgi:CubicO group peptidase (beta-lactamase class C family)